MYDFSVVLIYQEKGKEYPMFFPKDSIQDITIIDSTDEGQITQTELTLNLLESACTEISEDVKIKRRTSVKNWLLKNRFPIIEDGDKLRMDQPSVVINPPYRSCDCVTDNPIVLDSIQKIINNLPNENLSTFLIPQNVLEETPISSDQLPESPIS